MEFENYSDNNQFHNLINIKNSCNSLETEIRWKEPHRALDDKMISIIERKASQMKKEINRYIDSQAEQIIKHST